MTKRLRHKYPNSEVFHPFFHNNELGYTQGSSSSWRGNICYSYSSELGYADFERKVFYLRNGSYSPSTSKHQSHLKHSIPKDWDIIYISVWQNWSRSFMFDGKLIPNLKYELDSEISRLSDNKYDLYHNTKYFGDSEKVQNTINYWEKTLKLANQYDEYFEWFKIEALRYSWDVVDFEVFEIKTWALKHEFTGSFKNKKKHFEDPILKAKVESVEYKLSNDVKRSEDAQKRLLSKEAKELKKQEELLIKWKEGKYYGSLYNIPIHLRIEWDEVKTTQGARVPLKDAERLFKLFLTVSNNKQGYTSDSKAIKIGQYALNKIYLDTIDNQWKILIGCHLICEKQIKEFISENNLEWS